MNRFCIALVITLTLGFPIAPAKGQSLTDLFELGCSNLGITEGYEWICRAGELTEGVSTMLDELHQEFTAFGRDLFDDWLQDALASVAEKTGLPELNGLFAELDAALAEGPTAFRTALRDGVARLRAATRNARQAPAALIAQLRSGKLTDNEVLYDIAVQTNPNVVAAEGILGARQDQVVETRAESAAVHELNTQLAQEVAESTSMQDAVGQVLAPAVAGVGGGDAAQLDDAARTAVSSRAAIQTMTEGMADLMRQQATFSGTLSEQLKVLAQQQVMTTWELQLTVATLTEQINTEIAKEKAEIEASIARDYDVGVELAESLGDVASGAAASLAPNMQTLSFDSLGWGNEAP